MNLKHFIFSAIQLGVMNSMCAQSHIEEKLIELDVTNITASRIPIQKTKATRLVQVINAQEIEASSAQSVNDLLKLVAGVDVRQRGGYGIQTDIGINGGTEDQLTVMLNGVNITNPHTGHLTMDLPVSINDIERIEVIEGGASRVYGSSAFSGVINIITKSEKTNSTSVNLIGASYGTFGADAHINLLSGQFKNRISGGWTQSDGASDNNDFKKGNLYWNEKFSNDYFDVKLQAGMSSMKYGASTFYGTGSQTQYEENNRYLLSLQGEIKSRLHIYPQIYLNRAYDHYIWMRHNPTAYENHHQTNVYGSQINAWTQWSLGRTALGLEYRRENILSTRLGLPIDTKEIQNYPGYKYKDGRSNINIYLEHDILLDNWSISAGLLANKNTRLDESMRLYPGIDISYSPINGLRFYASMNQSQRIPTFTELYYNGPGLVANSQLKSEKSTDYSVGFSLAANSINFKLTGFYRKGTDMIDWVKNNNASTWTTANSDIDNLGINALLVYCPKDHGSHQSLIQFLSFGYCYNYQHRKNEYQNANYENQLVFLRHKIVATIRHRIFKHLNAQWEFVYKDRNGWFENAQTGSRQKYSTFGQLDLRLQWQRNQYTAYVQANNLTNKEYYDVANVCQPGCWFTAGFKHTIDF